MDINSTRRQLHEILDADLRSIPYLDGVNNHMGSLLTRHPGHMAWLMSELRRRGGLFFVDSYTTPASVALQMAREAGVPATRRDVFLDTDPSIDAIEKEFERLKALARKHGDAVAIGHPYDETLDYLERALPRLRAEGIELVSVSDVIHRQNNAR
ncbi:MAG TPA: divergent polysaccharide deacetylase family protein [Chromatiales bacterium]|nr:divergent polysaccharide deacetylase family protein [Chromatiales bacterium]